MLYQCIVDWYCNCSTFTHLHVRTLWENRPFRKKCRNPEMSKKRALKKLSLKFISKKQQMQKQEPAAACIG